MNVRLEHLRDILVALDVADEHHRPMSAGLYRAAALAAHRLVREELGRLPMAEFFGPIPSLMTVAENIYFETHGRLADIDGTGDAERASEVCGGLLARCAVVAGSTRAGRAG